MNRNWEQEKAYRAKRAEELRQQMEQAIANRDGVTFRRAFKTSLGYMKKSDRHELMMKFIEMVAQERTTIG